MKSLILGAGEGSRLYPLTRITAKPLLDIKGKPILAHIMDSLDTSRHLDDEVYIIYPNECEHQFNQFRTYFQYNKKIELISDKNKILKEMPGSVRSIAYVVNSKNIKDDLLVVAGDNLFDFRIDDFLNFYYSNGKKTSIAVYDIEDKDKIANKYGCVVVEDKKIKEFEEKPANPKSSLVSTLCYILSKDDLHHLDKEILKDNAGELIKDLVDSGHIINAFQFKGKWFDVGTPEDLERARKEF